ncbi:hypothetical protein EGW08_005942, partial [Elysia chlorotica]
SRIDPDITTWNLQIRHVRPSDAGLYECQVTTRIGVARLIQLNVVGEWGQGRKGGGEREWRRNMGSGYQVPSVPVSVCGAADMHGCLISITGKKYVDLGEKIELTCNASGGKVMPDEIDWFKGGDKIDSGEEKYQHVFILKSQFIASNSFTSTLIINHSKLTDSGNYICRSSRNDIANLYVTVFYAASDTSRRGTGSEPQAHDRQKESEYNHEPSSGHVHRHTWPLTALICVVMLTLLRLCPITSL